MGRAGFYSQSKSEKKDFSLFFSRRLLNQLLTTTLQCKRCLRSGCVHMYREDKWRTKLSRLLIDGGTTVLRSVVDGFHLPAKPGS